MGKARSFIILIIIFSIILSNQTILGTANHPEIMHSGKCGSGFRYNIQGWVYIHIEGEPYDRGYQYGYLASAEIVDMINRWSNWGHKEKFMKLFILKNRPGRYDELSKTYWNLCKKRAIKFFWDQYPKEYQQEIRGIADGVRDRGGTVHGNLVDYKDIFTLNEIEETRETYNNPGGIGRPFKTAFNMLKGAVKGILKGTALERFVNEEFETGSCTAFLATGDATVDGRIVFSHSTIFPPNYIPQRANIILDVQPSEGHRFVMTVFPGYIWSSEDYYQNDCGILLAETSIWPPVGPWKVRGTTSVGVRARRAIQYSESIDDVIKSMLNGNNGLYPADWVMGDTKTGEIASLELGLYNHAITRTKNGFLWSNCNAKNAKVRWDLWSVFGFGIMGRIFKNIPPFKYTPWPQDKKFEELGNKYYGKIDVDVVKKIMATPPISDYPIDCKITDSKLVDDFGLWAYMGKPSGDHFTPKQKDVESLKGLTEVPGAGWVKLYASNSQPAELQAIKVKSTASQNCEVIWTYETDNARNVEFILNTLSEETLIVSNLSGVIYGLDVKNGNLLWKYKNNNKPVCLISSKDFVFIGTHSGLYAIDKNKGRLNWEKKIGKISSKPIIYEGLVITGCNDGNIYAIDIETGEIKWNLKFADSIYLSPPDNNIIYINSDDTCHAFDINKQKTTWKRQLQRPITTPPIIQKNMVYVGSWDGKIYALDKKTGETEWVYQTGWGIDSTPTIKSGKIFFGSTDNNFYALNAETGDLQWHYTCKAAIHSSPTVYGEYVFFGSDDGRFYALNKTDGSLAWSYTPGYYIKDNDVNNYITTPIVSDPVVKDGVVYFGAKGNVYALDAQTVEKTTSSLEKSGIIDYTLVLLLSLLVILLIVIVALLIISRKKRWR